MRFKVEMQYYFMLKSKSINIKIMNTKFLKFYVLSLVLVLFSCDNNDANPDTDAYVLNETSSTIEWKGYSPDLFHEGSFSVKGENLKVVDGVLQNASFTIPIVSIKNFDLPDEVKPELLNHLKSPDFFNIAVHPNAVFKITQVKAIANSANENNFTVTGDFTMLGKTHSISFSAHIQIENNSLVMEAEFTLDRTKWGMNYGADPELGAHHIKPGVDITFLINAAKK